MSRIANISLETIAPITTNLAAVSHDDDAPRSPSAQLQVELDQQVATDSDAQLSNGKTVAVIGTISGITMVSSFSTGLLTVGLPRMAQDLNLASNLLLWYVTLSFCNYGSTIAFTRDSHPVHGVCSATLARSTLFPRRKTRIPSTKSMLIRNAN